MNILYVIKELCFDEEDETLLSTNPIQVWDNFRDAQAECALLRNLAPEKQKGADYRKYYLYTLTPLYLNKTESNFDIKLYCIELSKNDSKALTAVTMYLYGSLDWESINPDPGFWSQNCYTIFEKENSIKICSTKSYEHAKACGLDYSLCDEYKRALYELVLSQ